MQQKIVQIFLQQEAAAFDKNIGKESQNSHPILKNMYIIYLILQKNDSHFLTLKVA